MAVEDVIALRDHNKSIAIDDSGDLSTDGPIAVGKFVGVYDAVTKQDDHLNRVEQTARRGEKSAAEIPGDPNNPRSWRTIVDYYLLSLELRALSPATIYGRRRGLARFADWNLDQNRSSPLDVDKGAIYQYQVHLHHHMTQKGTQLAVRSRQQYLITVRGVCAWLRRTDQIKRDPAIDIELPKAPDQLPRHFLAPDETETVIAIPDINTTLGRRDHTMLEVLYAIGIRRTELANICLDDLNLRRRSLLIRHGKGARDRLIPIGERAATSIAGYLIDTRPELCTRNPDEPALFITRASNKICTAHIGAIVARYLRLAGIPTGNCHTFRHTMATLMLQGGADLRSIQTMLGHRNLASTQRYTHIDIDHLTRVHTASHPGAQSTRQQVNRTSPTQ